MVTLTFDLDMPSSNLAWDTPPYTFPENFKALAHCVRKLESVQTEKQTRAS